MPHLQGYKVIGKIYESARFVIYRGRQEIDNKAVVLKLLNEEFPSPESLAKFKREYEMTRKIDLDGVVKAYDLVRHSNSFVMVLEDFGGESLLKIFSGKSLLLRDFLSLSIKASDILGHIHALHIIHKDVTPSNIIWNPKTDVVKFTDFGISSELSREEAFVLNPTELEGTLSYMSPEQTGRMNRAVDYRSDFYSFGVSLYRLLTNRLPFQSDDPMSIVHSHIAKMPPSPHEIFPECPKVLSDIILKLMAKNAEDRYQSIAGLKADLTNCLDQLESKGRIDDFEIGQNDMSDRFQIPQKLYGRDEDLKAMVSAFDRVSLGTKEIVMVTGHAGIGKSALVHEFKNWLLRGKDILLPENLSSFSGTFPMFP